MNFTMLSNTQTTFVFNNLTRTTWFRPVVKNGSCNEVAGNPIQIVVNNAPVGGMTMGDATVCVGTNSGMLTLTGNIGNVIRWERSTNGFVNVVQILNQTTTHNYTNLTETTQFRPVVEVPGCGTQNATPATVVVVGQSQGGFVNGGTTVCGGTNSGLLTLTNYVGNVIRWERSTDAGFVPADQLPNTTVNQNYGNLTQTTYFRALVGSANCAPVYSSVAAVFVSQPSVGGQVNMDMTVCTGTNTGTLTLSGNVGMIVRWERSIDGNAWTSVSNTSNTWTFNNLMQTTWYRAVVKNGACPEANSMPAKVEVSQPTVAGQVSGNATVCANVNTGQVMLSGNVGMVVRWESSMDCQGFMPVTPPNMTPVYTYRDLPQTMCFRAVVKNGACAEMTTNAARIEVTPGSVGGTVNGGATVCGVNANGTLTLTGFSGTIVRWESRTDMQMPWASIQNTTPTLTYSNLTRTTWFRAVVQRNGCPETTSAPAEVNVSSPSVGGNLAGGVSGLCFGSNSGVLTVSNFVGNIERWESSLDGNVWTDEGNGGSTTYTYGNMTETLRFRVVVKSGSCPEAFSNVATIGVAPELVLNAGAVTGCTNTGSITAAATGGNGGYIYSLSPNRLPDNSNGQFANLDPGVYTITVRDARGCTASTTVSVSPTPTPTSIVSVTNITISSAVVTWATVPGNGVTYNLRYRLAGETSWTLLTGLAGNSRFLSGLQNNSDYDIQVQYICPGGIVSDFSTGVINQFRTLTMGTGDCATSSFSNVPVPGGIYIDNVVANAAMVHWNLVANALGYIISWGPETLNPNNWQQEIVCHPTQSYLMTNLSPNTRYRVRVRTNCSNCITALNSSDKRSVFSNQFPFVTPANRLDEVSVSTDLSMSVYPNPTKDAFSVQLSADVNGSAVLYDALGREVARESVAGSELNFNISGLTSGVYTLKLTANGSTKAVKVVKE